MFKNNSKLKSQKSPGRRFADEEMLALGVEPSGKTFVVVEMFILGHGGRGMPMSMFKMFEKVHCGGLFVPAFVTFVAIVS